MGNLQQLHRCAPCGDSNCSVRPSRRSVTDQHRETPRPPENPLELQGRQDRLSRNAINLARHSLGTPIQNAVLIMLAKSPPLRAGGVCLVSAQASPNASPS